MPPKDAKKGGGKQREWRVYMAAMRLRQLALGCCVLHGQKA